MDIFHDGVEVFCTYGTPYCMLDPDKGTIFNLADCPLGNWSCDTGCTYFEERGKRRKK